MIRTTHRAISTLFAVAALASAASCGTIGAPETTPFDSSGAGGAGDPGDPGDSSGNSHAGGTGGTGTAPAPQGAAALFWKAFHERDHAAIADVRQALDDELDAGPNPYATFLRAHVDLWELVEVVGLGGDASAKATLALAALDHFERAMEENPNDMRLHAWHGLLVTGVADATFNPLLYQQGIDEIESASASTNNGLVGGFTLMSVLARNASYDPRFSAAVEATWEMVELCAGGPVDRAHPDMTGVPISAACSNDSLTPHAWEGFWLSAGDILAKAGEGQVAATLYDNARLSPDFGSWRYRPELEQHLGDLEARIAAYGDLDPSNDPPVGASALCNGCHTTTAVDLDP